MKRLQALNETYRIREDVRVEPVRLGKYVYLAMLGSLLVVIVHTLFGHLYMLSGEGFVYADSEEIALEFDATVSELAVSEGTPVKPGDLLLRYESIELQQQLVDLALRLSRLHQELNDARISLARVGTNLKAADKYARFAQELEGILRNLKDRGLITSTQLGPELERSYDALQSLTGYRAEQQQIEAGIKTLEANIARVERHYQRLLSAFNDGEIRAASHGVVTGLEVSKGSVLDDGRAAMRVFSNERYILCYFDTRSFVSYQAGDPVLVRLPDQGLVVARIKQLTQVSNRLPDEFQPRFKPQQRQQLALIEVDRELLNRSTVLSTVSASKPPLLDWLLELGGRFGATIAADPGQAASLYVTP